MLVWHSPSEAESKEGRHQLSSLPAFHSAQDSLPREWSWPHFRGVSHINLIPYKYAQRSICQVILDFVKLTVNINYHRDVTYKVFKG